MRIPSVIAFFGLESLKMFFCTLRVHLATTADRNSNAWSYS